MVRPKGPSSQSVLVCACSRMTKSKTQGASTFGGAPATGSPRPHLPRVVERVAFRVMIICVQIRSDTGVSRGFGHKRSRRAVDQVRYVALDRGEPIGRHHPSRIHVTASYRHDDFDIALEFWLRTAGPHDHPGIVA